MKFKMEVNMDNAAFEDNPNELEDLVLVVLNKLHSGIAAADLWDSNGNKVGWFQKI